jgi:hypothetical protein
LGIVLARGVPSKVPKPAFLEELVLVKGHALRMFMSLDGEIHGALSGPRGERRFGGRGADEIEAAARGWLRIRKRRERGWPRDDGVEFFLVRGRPLFDEDFGEWLRIKGSSDACSYTKLFELGD